MIKRLLPLLTIVLLVSHVAPSGERIETRSDMATMGECKREKSAVIAGFEEDAVEIYSVRCLRTK